MKKEPLIPLLLDTHLSHKNKDLIISIFTQCIVHIKSLGLKVLYHAGDLFDSRKHQTLETLNAFSEILQMLESENIELRIIPGNHDKPDYNSEKSYLDIYRKHPNLTLVRDYRRFAHKDIMIHMIPFFDEKETYPLYLDKINISKSLDQNILITHIAVDGVKNNDGSQIEETLSLNKFKLFDKVFVGHYHNKQEVGNITYCGSAYQKDFGEDDKKGLTIIYTDGTIEQIKLISPKFETIKIDLNKMIPEKIDDLFNIHKNTQDNIRFKFSGTKEKLASIDKSKYDKAGIDIKIDPDNPEIDLDYAELIEFTGFDSKKILTEWNIFTKTHKIEKTIKEKGIIRLNKTFNN